MPQPNWWAGICRRVLLRKRGLSVGHNNYMYAVQYNDGCEWKMFRYARPTGEVDEHRIMTEATGAA